LSFGHTSAVQHVSASGPGPWCENAWWADQIDRAITTADPVLANLRITVAHYQLSRALRATLAPAPGANFHTWATWGSKKAGTTIRQADVPHIHTLALLTGGMLGLLGSAATATRRPDVLLRAATVGTLLASWGCQALTQHLLDHASRLILGGNITVLDEIGRQTARFVSTFRGHPLPEPQRLADFLGPLRSGPTAVGGQGLLKHAFTHYYQARHAPDRRTQCEQMLLANLYAILHEHIRLQPYIAGAMPRVARRLITQHLLTFCVGRHQMSAGQDVVPWVGGYGPELHPEVASAELRRFLVGLGGRDGRRDSVQGSRAANWADIRERMKFICALFRTGHGDPGLFSAPYTAAQRLDIAAGRIPSGAL